MASLAKCHCPLNTPVNLTRARIRLLRFLLFVGTSSRLCSGLVTGFTGFVHVKLPRSNQARILERETATCTNRATLNNNIIDYGAYEERDRQELEWLVRTTSHLLGPNFDTNEITPSMTKRTIHRTILLMKSWTRRASMKGSKAPHVVERILKRLVQERDAGNQMVKIDTKLYNILLKAWSRCREKGSAERCEDILLRMQNMHLNGINDYVKPNVESYNHVIKAIVQHGNRRTAVEKAENLVSQMLQDDTVSPNRRSFNLLLYAVSNSSQKNAGERAESILHTMKREYDNGQGNVFAKVDTNTYNQVMGAWVRCRQPGFEAKIQALFDEIVSAPKEMSLRPDTDTFNALLGGYLKSKQPDSLTRIEETLQVMHKDFEAGNDAAKPDHVTMNTLTTAYVKHGKADEETISLLMDIRSSMREKYGLEPDTVSQNMLIDRWCKMAPTVPNAPEKAMDLLEAMEQRFKDGDDNAKPDAYTYSSIIDCFTKSGRPDAAEEAEELLHRMEDLFRHHDGDPVVTEVYNSLMNAWACSDSEFATDRVQALLQAMEENPTEDPCIPKPDRISYNTILKAIAKQSSTLDEARSAEDILNSMDELGRQSKEYMPDSYSFTSAILAFGRSNADCKADKAVYITRRLLDAYQSGNVNAKPCVQVFNAGLNACAFVKGDYKMKAVAFGHAETIWEFLCEHSRPDHTSYGTMLRCATALLPSSDKRRQQTIDHIFEEACKHGMVGNLVKKQMEYADVPSQQLSCMPASWTRNVRERTSRKI